MAGLGALLAAGSLVVAPTVARATPEGPDYEACTENCHKDIAPPPTAVEGERDWMQRAGTGKGRWARRGVHSEADRGRCFDCHKPDTDGKPVCVFCHWDKQAYYGECRFCHPVHGDDEPVVRRPHVWIEKFAYPPGADPTVPDVNCGQGCHAWVDGSVVSRGFTNASLDPEQTTYRGTIRPGELLAQGQTAHSASFADKGCAACHDPVEHGVVKDCVECHNYKIFTPDPERPTLHLTHIPFIQAEQPLADPENFDQRTLSCNYCHGAPMSNASCWNCHLSGHDPVTPYWEPGAPVPAV